MQDHVFRILLVILLEAAGALGQGESPPAVRPSPQPSLLEGEGEATPRDLSDLMPLDRFQGFAEPFADMDWKEEAERLRKAVTLVWQRNGWTDEADLFARDVACEVTVIPPWEVITRLNLLTTRIAERYGLKSDQAVQLQGALFGEAGMFVTKNSKILFEFGAEALAGRARGEPFTAEQVQRWAQALQPLLAGARESTYRLSQRVEPWLDAEHKSKLDQDLKSFEKRDRLMEEMQARWAAGKWQASDWGMENDPIQTGALKPATAPAASAPPPPLSTPTSRVTTSEGNSLAIPTHWVAYDPKTWIAYVLDFEGRFGLDAGQKNSARSIHHELFDRATDYAQAHRAELEPVAVGERAKHEAYEPIRSLFAELQARLDSLPTTEQRESKRP